MNVLFKVLTISALWLTACTSGGDRQAVILDSSTPLNQLKTTAEATVAQKGDLLWVTSAAKNNSGIQFDKAMDLSGYGEVVVEICNPTDNEVEFDIRFDGADANLQEEKGIFRKRVQVGRGKTESFSWPFNTLFMHPEAQELLKELQGIPPYKTWGYVAQLDPKKVISVSIYPAWKPYKPIEWGVKRLYVKKDRYSWPDWFAYPKEKLLPFIDKYGQFKFKEWPGKIHSDAELQQAKAEEAKDLAANPGPTDRSKFFGWANGPRQEATGHFYVKKVDGKWWMVDPEGYLYWSHGLVRVTPSSAITPLDNGRKSYFEELPTQDSEYAQFYTLHDELLRPYYVKWGIKETYNFSAANIMRKYGANWKEEFAEIAHKRMHSWGITTIANSSDPSICAMDKTPYCDRVELKSPNIEGSHGGWWKFKDPFHPDFKTNLRALLLGKKQELDDPWCIGMFVDNELEWGNDGDLARFTLASPASQLAKQEFRKDLQRKYATIARLNAQWKSDYKSWDDLLERTDVKPGEGANEDLMAFSIRIMDGYFGNVREVFKEVAPQKLYLGCRFAGGAPDRVIIAAAKYCDVISYNIYKRNLTDLRLPDAATDRPIMIGEFHCGSTDRGMFLAGLIDAGSQENKGVAYADYVRSCLLHPNIIGTHWHQYSDQATTGRFDGEALQVGFTDVCDTPYPEVIKCCREIGREMYTLRNGF